MDAPLFDFDEVFDSDYLYFYGLRVEQSDSDADAVWRLLELERDHAMARSRCTLLASCETRAMSGG